MHCPVMERSGFSQQIARGLSTIAAFRVFMHPLGWHVYLMSGNTKE